MLADKNRVFNNGITEFTLEQELNLFNDSAEVKTLLTKFIEDELEKARKQGAQEQLQKIEAEVRKDFRNYTRLVSSIVDYVNDQAPKKLHGKDFKIQESRANFDFYLTEVHLLFIIDADLDMEFEFSKLLTETRKEILEVENVYADLFYINSRHGQIDKRSIAQDYPAQRDRHSKSK